MTTENTFNVEHELMVRIDGMTVTGNDPRKVAMLVWELKDND